MNEGTAPASRSMSFGEGRDPNTRQSKPPKFDEDQPVTPGSVVEFMVWQTTAGSNAVLWIDGDSTWRRPLIGMQGNIPIVNVEGDELYPAAMTAVDYLQWVFGDDLAQHISAHSTYLRGDPERPTGEAPAISQSPLRSGDY